MLLAGSAGSWAQAPAFTQAVSFNPTAANGTSISAAIALDAAGNEYITGTFSGRLVLGATTLISAGGEDIFVAKRNAATGAWLWAVRAGSSSVDDYSYGVAVDAMGNALVTGSFRNTASFGTAPLATNLTAAGGQDVFVAKFIAGTGTCAWAVRAGGFNADEGLAVAVDAAGNALVTGRFAGTASFATTPTTNLTAAGNSNAFVAKFAAGTGTCTWAVQAGGSSGDEGVGVAVDAAGNALITGNFSGTANFATSPTATSLISVGGTAMFVAKFVAGTGACSWAVQAGGGVGAAGYGVAVDAAGNALVTGAFTGTTDFGAAPTATSLISAGSLDVFVAKFVAGTGACAWAVRAGGSSDDNGLRMAVDAAGNALVTGGFTGTAGFGAAPAATSLISAGSADMFVAKFVAGTGACAWAIQAGGSGNAGANGVAVDANGNVLLTGNFFGPTTVFGNQVLTGSRFTGFVATLAGAGTLTTAPPLPTPQPTLAPNPARTAFTLTLPPITAAATATATLLNALGQTISTRTLTLAPAGTTARYETAGLAPGLYTLRVQAGGETTALRVVVE